MFGGGGSREEGMRYDPCEKELKESERIWRKREDEKVEEFQKGERKRDTHRRSDYVITYLIIIQTDRHKGRQTD